MSDETRTETTPAWRGMGWREEALVDADGRIVGEVSGGYRRWSARTEMGHVGDFVEIADAKRAVQRAMFGRYYDARF